MVKKGTKTLNEDWEGTKSLKNRNKKELNDLVQFWTEKKLFLKGTGHFFETLSVGSVPGTDHS